MVRGRGNVFGDDVAGDLSIVHRPVGLCTILSHNALNLRHIIYYYVCFHTDIDECTLGDDSCVQDAECVDNEGSYTCVCYNGYSGDGFGSCSS